MGFEPKIDLSAAVEAATKEPLTLERFKLNHASPFWSAADGHIERLEEAHALLTILSDGFKEADAEPNSAEPIDGMTLLRPMILGRALAGVQTLVALSLYQHQLSKKD